MRQRMNESVLSVGGLFFCHSLSFDVILLLPFFRCLWVSPTEGRQTGGKLVRCVLVYCVVISRSHSHLESILDAQSVLLPSLFHGILCKGSIH